MLSRRGPGFPHELQLLQHSAKMPHPVLWGEEAGYGYPLLTNQEAAPTEAEEPAHGHWLCVSSELT